MPDFLQQLSEQKRKVDFNTYDMSVKEIVSMVVDGTINISPDYQRQFRWEPIRQSKLIESIFLGIPVPPLFMATNSNYSWEVIDGVQRISTIINYIAPEGSPIRQQIGHLEPLKLEGLDKLTDFNKTRFAELPSTIQLEFNLKPVKIITLSDKSDNDVRFDLFERLNTGGVRLSDQEIRSCIYQGPFNEFIKRLAQNNDFRNATKKAENADIDGTYEELVLRFFAYLYGVHLFRHNVKDFLNEYMSQASSNFNYIEGERIFTSVFSQLNRLENGIVKSKNVKKTSTVFWEAITVGAAKTILGGKNDININGFYEWAKDSEFNKLVTGATNSAPRIEARISFAQGKFSQDDNNL